MDWKTEISPKMLLILRSQNNTISSIKPKWSMPLIVLFLHQTVFSIKRQTTMGIWTPEQFRIKVCKSQNNQPLHLVSKIGLTSIQPIQNIACREFGSKKLLGSTSSPKPCSVKLYHLYIYKYLHCTDKNILDESY